MPLNIYNPYTILIRIVNIRTFIENEMTNLAERMEPRVVPENSRSSETGIQKHRFIVSYAGTMKANADRRLKHAE